MKAKTKEKLILLSIGIMLGGYGWAYHVNADPWHALWIVGLPVIITAYIFYKPTNY